MEKDYVSTWKSSVQARKQRKYLANAPLHKQVSFFGVHLSKDLQKKFGVRSLTIRSGDTVKVVRGQHKGKTGKIQKVLRSRRKITIEGVDVTRRDGAKALVPLHPSNVVLIDIVADRKRKTTAKKTENKR